MPLNELHFGVAVGINRYPDIGHLRLAKGDAEAFSEWLSDPNGGALPTQGSSEALLPEGHVATVVVDNARMPLTATREEAVPTRKEVLEALMKFRRAVEARVKENPKDWHRTRLYIYVSGHGLAPTSKDAALLLANAGPDWYGENISCGQLIEFFAATQPFKEVVVFADCCREIVPNVPLGGLPWGRNTVINGNVLTVLGCATFFGDMSYEPPEGHDPDGERGYYTKALLEALRGGVAPQADGRRVIDSNSVGAYVRQRMLELTRHRDPPQQPTMTSDTANPVVFGELAGIPKYAVEIHFPPGVQGTATLRDGTEALLQAYQMGDGAATAHLAIGLYSMTPDDPAIAFAGGGIFRVLGSTKRVQL